MRLLAKDPEDRYQSAAGLLAEGAPAVAMAMTDTEMLPAARTNVARQLFGDREPLRLGITVALVPTTTASAGFRKKNGGSRPVKPISLACSS